MKNKDLIRSVATIVVTGALSVGAASASAASPSPVSSCAGQLSQGGTPHGLSESAPGDLGRFVSGMTKGSAGSLGDLTSGLAQQHGDLFACISLRPSPAVTGDRS